jgi:hypothetical protein
VIVYHGPRDEVIPFFSSMGFEMPERKGVADVLQEITSRKDQKVRDLTLFPEPELLLRLP